MRSQKLRMLLISRLQISECLLSKHNDHLSAPILILGKRISWWWGGGELNLTNMEGDSTAVLLFCPKTAGRSLQCEDAYYRGKERTSKLSTFLTIHEQCVYKDGTKLERKMWHSLFDLQLHIRGKLNLCW